MPANIARRVAALALCLAMTAHANLSFDALDGLPPGEQYRQLSLMLLTAGGAEPSLVDAMLSTVDSGVEPAHVNPDDYRTPLTRIVDQDSMLGGAAHMFRFTRDYAAEIRARLDAIEADNPVLISMVQLNDITEDAIVIRQAIADSIEYSVLSARPDVPPLLQAYRTGTVRLRNVLEYELFSDELDRLTDEAIRSVGGKLDAYQRMFDDEMGLESFDRHIDAAEYIYNRDFNQQAGDMTEDIIKNIVLLESQPYQKD